MASNGTDSGACLRPAPCKTITYALTQVLVRGQVNILDSLTHGPFTVTKGVAIVAAPGAQVVVSSPAAGSTAITIQATDVVVLRGLTVMGHLNGKYGIWYKAAARVRVEGCVVSDFNAAAGAGINMSHSGGDLAVTDTIVRDNYYGMILNPSATSHVLVDRSRMEKNRFGYGIFAGAVYLTLSNSTLSGSAVGLWTSGSRVAVTNCVVENNGTGVEVHNGSSVTIGRSAVTLNGIGIERSSVNGHIYSMGDNMVYGNTTNVSGVIEFFSGS